MRKLSIVVGIVAMAALACSDADSQHPTSPSAPTVSSLEISGPGTVAPGQTAQLGATIILAGGVKKVPSASTPLYWFSSNTAVLRVSPEGLATAQQTGDARVTAIYGTGTTQRQAVKEFIVVPDGTYRLVGKITEAEPPSVPVIGARVTVTPGSLTTTTDAEGGYQLYGVAGDAVVTITKTGYLTVSEGVQLTSHATRNFGLPLDGTRVHIAGPYTLTLDFADYCYGNPPLSLPLQRRTYQALIAQIGPEVSVTLTEARFRTNPIGRGKGFTGRATSDGVTFILPPFDPYYYPYSVPGSYPSVVEQLSDDTVLLPSGTAVTTGSAEGLSGLMGGAVVIWDSRFPASNARALSFCSSSWIRFSLTPR